MLKLSLNKKVTTVRVPSGKVEVIIKQRSYKQQGFLVVKLKSSLNKNVTTARVTSGKVEVIIKQKRYYSKGS